MQTMNTDMSDLAREVIEQIKSSPVRRRPFCLTKQVVLQEFHDRSVKWCKLTIDDTKFAETCYVLKFSQLKPMYFLNLHQAATMFSMACNHNAFRPSKFHSAEVIVNLYHNKDCEVICNLYRDTFEKAIPKEPENSATDGTVPVQDIETWIREFLLPQEPILAPRKRRRSA